MAKSSLKSTEATLPKSSIEGVRRLIVGAEARLNEAIAEGAARKDIAALQNSAASLWRLHSKLSGELEVTTSMILRSTQWQQLFKVLIDALRPYPDASKAVADAIEALKNGSSSQEP